MGKPKLSVTLPLLLILLSTVVFAVTTQASASNDSPNVEWQRLYGTSSGIPKVIQTDENSYVFVAQGWSSQMSTMPSSLKKIDANGELVWSITARAVDIAKSYDDGYVMLQATSKGAALVKIDNNNQIQWNCSYPGFSVYTGKVVAASDSGYLIAISNSSTWDFKKVEGTDYRQFTTWLIKTDWSGNVQWEHTYQISDTNDIFTFEIQSLLQTSASTYIIGGTATMNSLDTNACVVKVNCDGELQWIKTYGGDKDDDFSALCQTSDGNYVLCGTSFSYNGEPIKVYPSYLDGVPPAVSRKTGDQQAWLVEIDSEGKIIWNRTYGVNTARADIYGTNDLASASSILETSDGKLTFAGSELRVYDKDKEYPMVGGTVIWLVKCDLHGNMLWSKDYDLTWQSNIDNTGYLMETQNGSYLIACTQRPSIGASCECFLINTESALPLPTPSPSPAFTPPQVPTSLLAPLDTPATSLSPNNKTVLAVSIVIILLAFTVGSLLFKSKHVKSYVKQVKSSG